MARNPVTARRHWRAGPAQPTKESAAKPLQKLFLVGVGIAVLGVAGMSMTRKATPPSAAMPLVIPALGDAAKTADPTSPNASTNTAASQPAFIEAAAAGSTAYRAGDYDGAVAQYREAIQRNPDDAEAHSNLGQVLVRMKQAEDALPHFDRAIQLIPNRWAYHFNRARALGILERWPEAVAGYRQAQQLYPDDYAIAFNLGQALQRTGDEAAAVEEFKRAAALDATDPSFQMAIGMAYERLKKPAETAAAYTEALRLAPEAPDAERVRARIAQLTRAGS